jgi:ATP-dependent DNA ligase
MPLLPDSIRYSETLKASPAELIEAVREQGFEGLVAKRRDSLYEPGKRSGA